jgi:hypothetical protein
MDEEEEDDDEDGRERWRRTIKVRLRRLARRRMHLSCSSACSYEITILQHAKTKT